MTQSHFIALKILCVSLASSGFLFQSFGCSTNRLLYQVGVYALQNLSTDLTNGTLLPTNNTAPSDSATPA